MTRLTQNEERKEERMELVKLMGERLKALMDESCTTIDILSEATGVSRISIVNLRSGKTLPETLLIIKLADYFAVPMDFLCGRMDEEKANEVLEDYHEHFMDIRRASYESYLRHRSDGESVIVHDDRIESVWPYNLCDEIFRCPTVKLLRSDQIRGLEEAVSMLTERERSITYGYYRDEIGVADLSRKYSISTERVRQLLKRSIRKLRHPSRARLIEKGYDLETEKKMEELEGVRADFERKKQELISSIIKAGAEFDRIAEITINELNIDPLDTPVEKLDLSTRSENALKRNAVSNVRDIIISIKNDSIRNFRCLGETSYNEIVKKIEFFTGKDMETLINEV